MQSYASALAASRDHLRGGLGLVGDTLASTHDLARILDVILASAITATSAQAGVVMLADPSDDQLRLECSQGFDEYAAAMLAPLVVRFGTGLLGAVAADGSARHGRRSAIVKPAVGEPPCDTFLAVPMRVAPSVGDQTGIRGVVALYDRLGGADFDESDRQALQVFAGQAAIAVDNVRQHDEAKRLSHTDPLTGLYNYRHLKDLLRREAHRAARFGHSLTVLVMDLDRFKEVNDTYGHAAGDAILVEFARRVGVEIRGVDLAFRYGGEEFVLLLPETDALGGVTVAQRLGSAVRDTPVTAPGGHASEIDGAVDVRITVSIGVAVYPDHGTSGDKVLEAADDALYAAKAAGRDTFRLAEPPRREEPDRLPLATPATLTAADVRGEVNREVGPLLAPRDVTPDQRTAKNNRPWRARRSRSGASATPPPPRQARGR
jgi:diguanylate cyclase (GGDEF)-like protein